MTPLTTPFDHLYFLKVVSALTTSVVKASLKWVMHSIRGSGLAIRGDCIAGWERRSLSVLLISQGERRTVHGNIKLSVFFVSSLLWPCYRQTFTVIF